MLFSKSGDEIMISQLDIVTEPVKHYFESEVSKKLLKGASTLKPWLKNQTGGVRKLKKRRPKLYQNGGFEWEEILKTDEPQEFQDHVKSQKLNLLNRYVENVFTK